MATLIISLFLLSCQTDFFPGDDAHPDRIEFSFTLPDAKTSRASLMGDGSGKFEDDDQISLFLGDGPVTHHILTFQEGAWTPALSREELGGETVTVNACYPAIHDASPEAAVLTFQLNTDQTGDGHAASDLLWAHQTITTSRLTGAPIELTLDHALHRLRLTVHDETGEQPSDLAIAVKGATGGQVSFADGSLQTDDTAEEWITPQAISGQDGVYHALLMPQPLKALQDGDGWIRITAHSKTGYYRAPDEIGSSSRLEPGKESVLSLRIKKNGHIDPGTGEGSDGEWANKKCWVYGVTSPVFDPAHMIILPPGSSRYTPGQWVCFRTEWSDGTYTDSYQLPWKEGCGWYDVSKTYEWDNAKDKNMCWAASSSNILHWWLQHNAAYVEAYDKQYGQTDYYKRYPRPSATFKPYPVRSDIFNGLFVNSFNNRGAGEGINWFINGSDGYGTSGLINQDMKDFKGYFKEVFANINMYEYKTAMSKANFNAAIKDALKNRKAIAFITNGNHNMTIWGAEFDEQGIVAYIYYVDNNPFGNSDPEGAAVIRKEITYKENAATNLKDQTYMGRDLITQMGTVPLRQDIWEKAFPQIHSPE